MSNYSRASKRIKELQCEQAEDADADALATLEDDYEARLFALNALPTESFRRKYVPPELLKFKPRGDEHASYRLDFYSAKDLPSEDFWRCYNLLVRTSRETYRLSTRGWHPDHKKKEMKEKSMRYLILRRDEPERCSDEEPQPTAAGNDCKVEIPHEYAFMSYQLDDDWTLDPNVRIPVCYIYEIHLTENLRGLGLGKHLMALASHIASVTGMVKLELSVFTSNGHAEKFYRSLGYDTDETSPQPRKVRGRVIPSDWLVLSKAVAKSDGTGEEEEQAREKMRKVERETRREGN